MTTATPTIRAQQGTTHRVDRPDGFHAVESEHSLGYNLPQRAGRRLWLPMFAMALMGWTAGIITTSCAPAFAVVAADAVDSSAVAAAGSGGWVALYLTGIAFGVGTIIDVVRFQAIRIRGVAEARGHAH